MFGKRTPSISGKSLWSAVTIFLGCLQYLYTMPQKSASHVSFSSRLQLQATITRCARRLRRLSGHRWKTLTLSFPTVPGWAFEVPCTPSYARVKIAHQRDPRFPGIFRQNRRHQRNQRPRKPLTPDIQDFSWPEWAKLEISRSGVSFAQHSQRGWEDCRLEKEQWSYRF